MEILLGLIIFTLLGYIVWKDYHFSTERKMLLTAALSKTSAEFVTATKIDEKEKVEEEVPDVIPQESLSDEEFSKSIHKEIEEKDGDR